MTSSLETHDIAFLPEFVRSPEKAAADAASASSKESATAGLTCLASLVSDGMSCSSHNIHAGDDDDDDASSDATVLDNGEYVEESISLFSPEPECGHHCPNSSSMMEAWATAEREALLVNDPLSTGLRDCQHPHSALMLAMDKCYITPQSQVRQYREACDSIQRQRYCLSLKEVLSMRVTDTDMVDGEDEEEGAR